MQHLVVDCSTGAHSWREDSPADAAARDAATKDAQRHQQVEAKRVEALARIKADPALADILTILGLDA